MTTSGSSDIENFINLLRVLYRKVGFDENVIVNQLDSLRHKGFCSILSLINAVRRKHREDCERVLVNIFMSIERYFNAKYIVFVGDIPRFGEPEKSVSAKEINDFLSSEISCNELARNKGVILVSEEFHKKIPALVTIFRSLWRDGDRFLPVLAWDKSGVLWDMIEGELLVATQISPPVSIFLPYFHAYKFFGNKYDALVELDKEARQIGLMTRVWGAPRSYNNRIVEVLKQVSALRDFSHFLTALVHTLRGELSIEDLYVYLIYIMGEEANEEKFKIISREGLFLSEKLKEIIEANLCEKIEKCVNEIRNALIEAEKKWFPEISIEEILNIPYGVEIDNIVVEEWLREFFSKIISEKYFYIRAEERILPSLIPSMKLALSLVLSKMSFESPSLILLVRYLVSLSNRLRYLPISILSNALDSMKKLSEDELEFAIFLQRFLEIHGPKPYLKLGKDVLGDKFIFAVHLGLLVNSNKGLGARKIIAYALKSTKVSNVISKHLGSLKGYKVKGFTIPIPWELEVGISGRRIEWVSKTIKYFEEVDVDPPEAIKLLSNIISFKSYTEQIIQNISRFGLRELVNVIAEIAKLESYIQKLKDQLVEKFGFSDVKFVRSAEAMLMDISARVNRVFERVYTVNYKEIMKRENFVSKAIELALQRIGDKPLIVIVVDGLRLDDYITKVKEKLYERHLKVVYEDFLLSYLPSITTFSRRAIFSGETPPKYLLFPGKISGVKLVKEGANLSERFKESIYIKGSIGEIQIKLHNMMYSNQLRGLKIIAIVLSDLEKAAHGSAEGFLARLTVDYADEIANIIQTAINVYYKVNKVVPAALLVSDHGLEKFTKIVEVDPKSIVRLAKNRGYLDPVYEVLTTPRYMIIPTISSNYAKRLITELDQLHKTKFWLRTLSDLGIEKVAMKMKEEKFFNLVEGDRVVIIFPRGERRFKVGPTRSVVYHGGPLPSEVLTPFAIIEPE